ncbi:hypothetical protein [Clostridium sp.]|uniref:hypothetical protein n=1 Tax=Clostridium sp. TaxID=1506 RepID=UPI003216F916
MNLKKLITNTLAVVGGVVIVDKVVNAVSNKSTEAISKSMIDKDFTEDETSDSCQCNFLDNDYEDILGSNNSEENNYSCDNSEIFPDIKKYEDTNHVFEYAIKTDTANSEPQQV